MNLIPRKFYLDDIFDDFVTSGNNNMKCDIYELNGDYHIEIESKNGYLTITASKESNDEEENKNYIRRERSYGKFERSFYLGDLDDQNIEAEFKDGMLKITVPKKEETNDKKFIEIK